MLGREGPVHPRSLAAAGLLAAAAGLVAAVAADPVAAAADSTAAAATVLPPLLPPLLPAAPRTLAVIACARKEERR